MRHGMCELTARHGHGMAGERNERDVGWAWTRHAMCESAFNGKLRGPEGRFLHFSDEKDSCPCLDSVPVSSLFAIPTEFSWQYKPHSVTKTALFGKHPYLQ